MKNSKLSRRDFLRTGAAALGLAAGSAVATPQAVQAAGSGTLCTVFDLKKCIGCEECVNSCREQWQSSVPDPVKPIPRMYPKRVPVQDWSGRKDVQDRLTPYNFLYVEMLEIEHKGEAQELNIPRRCMHCDNPPCTNLCPFGSGRVEDNGIVHIDKDLCLGGAKCKKVCPWHIPQRQSGVGLYLDILPAFAGNGAMFKCHRCLPLVKQGKQPRCVEACPENVQSIGPRDQMISQAIVLAKTRAREDGQTESAYEDYLYGLNENGGTSTLYVSPIPFEKVREALEKQHRQLIKEERAQLVKAGKKPRKGDHGRPHMNMAANSMASEENLAWAVLLAPMAGAAAGITRLVKGANKLTSDSSRESNKGGEA
jgi:formate dehydrogenase iron-sulfur subunit